MASKMNESAGVDWGERNIEAFESLEQIGEGTYGHVYKAKDKHTGKLVILYSELPFGCYIMCVTSVRPMFVKFRKGEVEFSSMNSPPLPKNRTPTHIPTDSPANMDVLVA